MKKIITYGTFDLIHRGHIMLLKRAKALGDHLTVGLSTDQFNLNKNKICVQPYEERKLILESLRYVDEVIPEESWEQKERDIINQKIDIFVMGSDWSGKFDALKNICKVIYLKRTEGISTTYRKKMIAKKFNG